ELLARFWRHLPRLFGADAVLAGLSGAGARAEPTGGAIGTRPGTAVQPRLCALYRELSAQVPPGARGDACLRRGGGSRSAESRISRFGWAERRRNGAGHWSS